MHKIPEIGCHFEEYCQLNLGIVREWEADGLGDGGANDKAKLKRSILTAYLCSVIGGSVGRAPAL